MACRTSRAPSNSGSSSALLLASRRGASTSSRRRPASAAPPRPLPAWPAARPRRRRCIGWSGGRRRPAGGPGWQAGSQLCLLPGRPRCPQRSGGQSRGAGGSVKVANTGVPTTRKGRGGRRRRGHWTHNKLSIRRRLPCRVPDHFRPPLTTLACPQRRSMHASIRGQPSQEGGAGRGWWASDDCMEESVAALQARQEAGC